MSSDPSPPDLPTELHDIIIDYLHDDRHTLAACALVCKAWLHTSRHHLFGYTSTNLNRVPQLAEVLQTAMVVPGCCPLHTHIRSLAISGPGDVEGRVVQNLLELLCKIEVLSLKYLTFTPLEHYNAVEGAVKTMTEELVSAIASLKFLRRLLIDGVDLGWNQYYKGWDVPVVVSADDLLIQLELLDISSTGENFQHQILHAVASAKQRALVSGLDPERPRQPLTRLSAHFRSSHTHTVWLSALTSLLHVVAPSLCYLDIDLDIGVNDRHIEHFELREYTASLLPTASCV